MSIALKRHSKYSSHFEKVVFSNEINSNYHTILYNECEAYSTRLYNCLTKLDSGIEYIILNHDWVILYDYINKEKIHNITKIMKENDIIQVRLWYNGIIPQNTYQRSTYTNKYIEENYIYDIPKEGAYQFTVQPTIWHLETLKLILLNHLNLEYRTMELEFYNYMLAFRNSFYYDNEQRFTENGFYKSSIYPHIHATSSGKWIISCYLPYSEEMINEFKIDTSHRGII